MSDQLTIKLEHLKQYLTGLGSAVVAFSGGVDSSFLLSVAVEVLGDRVLAVTATSETYLERERLEALDLARQIGCRHRMVVSEELDITEFKDNPRNRCYYCKKELFGKLKTIADEEALQFVTVPM